MAIDPVQIKRLLGLAIHQALKATPDKDPRRDLQTGEKLWIRAAGPMVDYLYDSNILTAVTKNYVDTVSGSIGQDLNHQVLELYSYVDAVSGSSVAQDLQSVTSLGNTTTNPLLVQVSGSTFSTLTVFGNTVIGGVLDIQSHKIINVTDPTSNQDAATKIYVDTISGSIGNNLEFNYATKTYVDTVSGSIGTDLNDQIHKVREYTDDEIVTVSGSIGIDLNHQVLKLYAYVDTSSGSSAQSLQAVTNIGNTTTQDITAANLIATTSGSSLKDTLIDGNLQVNDDLIVNGDKVYINHNGPEASSYFFFYENGSNQGAFLGWWDAEDRFIISHSLQSAIDLKAGGDLKAGDNIYINYDGADGDSYLYFYEGGSATGAFLKWDDGPGVFVFDHGISTTIGNSTFVGDVRIGDRLFVNSNGPEGDGTIFFYEGGAEGGAALWWRDSTTNFELSHFLVVASSGSHFNTLTTTHDLLVGGDIQGEYIQIFGQIDCQLPTGGTSGQGIAMTSFDGIGLLSLENGTAVANVMAPFLRGKASHTTASGLLIQGEPYVDDGTAAGAVHIRAKDPDGNSGIDAGIVLEVYNWTTSLLTIDYAGVVKIDANVLDMDSHKIINVTDPGDAQDAATKAYVDAASDERLKTNIVPLTGCLENVNQLNPIRFNWNDKGKGFAKDNLADTEVGLIAQEVAKVYPEVVFHKKDNDNNLAIDYSRLTAVLIKAIQELSSKVKDLELNKVNNDIK